MEKGMQIVKHIAGIALVMCIVLGGVSCERNHYRLKGIGNNREYLVWSSIHEWDDHDEWDILQPNYAIAGWPLSLRQIIAFYSTQIYWTEKDNYTPKWLGGALGGFSSLEEAQDSLLKDWTCNVPECLPLQLSFKKTGDSLVFYGVNGGPDVFRINRDGSISYVDPPEVNMPYNKNIVFEKLYGYKMLVDGEEVYWYYYYPDPDNVDSMLVCKRTRTIRIERKNKTPEYFSISDVDLTKLNFKVRRLSDITRIAIYAGPKFDINWNDNLKIEKSAIQSICSRHYTEFDYTEMIIIIKP